MEELFKMRWQGYLDGEREDKEWFLYQAAEALRDTFTVIWLCSLSEACAPLMIRLCPNLLSHCVYWYQPKLRTRAGTHTSVCWILWHAFFFPGLQYIRRSWLGENSSLPSILPKVHNGPGVDAHLQRFTQGFLYSGCVCQVAGFRLLARLHSSICGWEKPKAHWCR